MGWGLLGGRGELLSPTTTKSTVVKTFIFNTDMYSRHTCNTVRRGEWETRLHESAPRPSAATLRLLLDSLPLLPGGGGGGSRLGVLSPVLSDGHGETSPYQQKEQKK